MMFDFEALNDLKNQLDNMSPNECIEYLNELGFEVELLRRQSKKPIKNNHPYALVGDGHVQY